MSNLVFPTLKGVKKGSRVKTPTFATAIKKTVSQREVRVSKTAFPVWAYNLDFEYLRQSTQYTDWETLIGFFCQHHGAAESWLYNDPNDNAVGNVLFGVGDAATVAFQLRRPVGGFYEPVTEINGTPQIWRTDWQGTYEMFPHGRQNIATRSEELGYWPSPGIDIVDNATLAPDGTMTMDKAVEDTTTGNHYETFLGTIPSAGAWSVSCWAKPAERTRITMATDSGGSATFDVSTGSIIGTTGGAQAVMIPGPNATWRCAIYVTTTAAASSYIYLLDGTGAASYTGDGASGIYLWGGDIKSGGLTSYIKTGASAVSVTDYSRNSTGLITFASAPRTGALLNWSGNFYHRCRFVQDKMETQRFLQNFWKADRVEFVTVKP